MPGKFLIFKRIISVAAILEYFPGPVYHCSSSPLTGSLEAPATTTRAAVKVNVRSGRAAADAIVVVASVRTRAIAN